MTNDGGPAFPGRGKAVLVSIDPKTQEQSASEIGVDNPGMTLLDYFAGQALAGVMSNANIGSMKNNADQIFEACYGAARGMLNARDAQ